ncbi:MAG: hypothetical protein KDC82_02630, partial [Bacteroidetes bacterium]|nr:hypothetical protein [Bacteroidota bacterium]
MPLRIFLTALIILILGLIGYYYWSQSICKIDTSVTYIQSANYNGLAVCSDSLESLYRSIEEGETELPNGESISETCPTTIRCEEDNSDICIDGKCDIIYDTSKQTFYIDGLKPLMACPPSESESDDEPEIPQYLVFWSF